MKVYLYSLLIIFTLLSCKTSNLPCESIDYAYETVEIFPSDYDHAERLSRTHTNILNESISIVNTLINGYYNSSGGNLNIKRLVPLYQRLNIEDVKCDGLPIYCANKVKLPPCEVPYGKKIIVIDENFPEILSKTFFGNSVIDSLEILHVSNILAICLLHELGHIANNDYKKKISWEFYLKGDSLNTESTLAKEIEFNADAFAAFVILGGANDESNYNRRVIANSLINTMRMIEYNLTKKRVFNQKLYNIINPADLFKDQNFIYTNLELRFLQIDHMSSMSQKSGASITDFHSNRNK